MLLNKLDLSSVVFLLINLFAAYIKTIRLFVFAMDNWIYVRYVNGKSEKKGQKLCLFCMPTTLTTCKHITLHACMFGTTDYRTCSRNHRASHCRPIRDLLVDNRIMDSWLVDNVRQKRPIALKEHVTRHQILSLTSNINFQRNYVPLIFSVWLAPIITVTTSGFSGSKVNV